MSDPDPAKAGRVSEAMLKMVKFNIAELEAAARGLTLDASSRSYPCPGRGAGL
jgi:hypothetical protein